jgi:hypothetical protein
MAPLPNSEGPIVLGLGGIFEKPNLGDPGDPGDVGELQNCCNVCGLKLDGDAGDRGWRIASELDIVMDNFGCRDPPCADLPVAASDSMRDVSSIPIIGAISVESCGEPGADDDASF